MPNVTNARLLEGVNPDHIDVSNIKLFALVITVVVAFLLARYVGERLYNAMHPPRATHNHNASRE